MASTHIIAERAERIMMDAMVESYLQHSRSRCDNDGRDGSRACYYLQHQQGAVKSIIIFDHDRNDFDVIQGGERATVPVS
eukprot:scaffold17584_cov71-Skeletonema_dohrnii-CCMP3373.AAC.2